MWQNRLQAVLESWRGTPWMAGQCFKGRGADCTRFVMGVLDELYRLDQPLPERHAPDIAFHRPAAAAALAGALLARYPHTDASGGLEAGDVLVMRLAHGGPGHVGIVGHGALFFWHCDVGVGVQATGIGWPLRTLLHAWRPLEKEGWA